MTGSYIEHRYHRTWFPDEQVAPGLVYDALRDRRRLAAVRADVFPWMSSTDIGLELGLMKDSRWKPEGIALEDLLTPDPTRCLRATIRGLRWRHPSPLRGSRPGHSPPPPARHLGRLLRPHRRAGRGQDGGAVGPDGQRTGAGPSRAAPAPAGRRATSWRAATMTCWLVVLTRHPRGAPGTARHQVLYKTGWCWWARVLARYVAVRERPSWACPQVTVTVYEEVARPPKLELDDEGSRSEAALVAARRWLARFQALSRRKSVGGGAAQRPG